MFIVNISTFIYLINIYYFIVVLEAPDTVLIERAAGKRIDPKTKGEE